MNFKHFRNINPFSCLFLSVILTIIFYIFLCPILTKSQILLEINPNHDAFFQIFYDTGKGFSEKQSEFFKLKSDSYSKINVLIDSSIKNIRLDPDIKFNEIKINKAYLDEKPMDFEWIRRTFIPYEDVQFFNDDYSVIWKINETKSDPKIFISQNFLNQEKTLILINNIVYSLLFFFTSLTSFLFHNNYWIKKLEKNN
tara:strand:- start:4237 stop:4830 length:594 start_codon:yes stop_codon:yes gene_type:complete